MTSANVLPSAPSYNEAQPLYPTHEITQLNAENFRLKKINDLLKELSDEAEHYRQVAKKYNRTLHCAQLGGWTWIAFFWAVLRSPSHRLDRVWYCCQPRTCWCCYCVRVVLCWVCSCKQEVGA